MPISDILKDRSIPLSKLTKQLSSTGSSANTFVSNGANDGSGADNPYPTATHVATTNISLSGLPILNGIQVVAGEIVLCVAQTDAKNNGLFVSSSGSWKRASIELINGLVISVQKGGLYENSIWVVTSLSTKLLVGTDNIIITQIVEKASGTGTEIQFRGSNGKFGSLVEFFMDIANKTFRGFKAIFSSNSGTTLNVESTASSALSNAVKVEALNATGVEIDAQVPIYATGKESSWMSVNSSVSGSYVFAFSNDTPFARTGHGIYVNGNSHNNSVGVNTVGMIVTKRAFIDATLQLNSRYETSNSTTLNNYSAGSINSIEFRGLTGQMQTLTGISSGIDGQLIVLHSKALFTIANNSTSSDNGNRIDTMKGVNLVSDANGFMATLRYNGRRSIWECIAWHRNLVSATQTQVTVITNGAGTTYNTTTQNYINGNAVQLNNARADIATIMNALRNHGLL